MPADEVAVKKITAAARKGESLSVRFTPQARALQASWIKRIRAEGLLCRLGAEEIQREAGIVFHVWNSFIAGESEEEPQERIRWMAERSLLVGRSIDETLRSFFILTDVGHRWLERRGDAGELLLVLDRFSEQLIIHLSAAIAAERERLARHRMNVLVEAGSLLTREEGLSRVLQKIVELAREIVGTRYAALGVLDDAGKISHFVTAGIDSQTRERIGTLPTGCGILGVALHKPVRLADIQADPRSSGFPPGHPSMRSFLGVPITARGRTYGNLYLTEKHDGQAFTEEDEMLVSTFASQAAAAIEGARSAENLKSLEQSKRRERQHAELLQRVIAAQEEERKRVARELHDRTGQSLTSLMIGLRRLESMPELREAHAAVSEMRQQAGRTLDELRYLAFELRPSVLDDLGLAVALQRYARDFVRRTDIRLELELSDLEGIRLDPAVETALYRIVQEALTNVDKHAQARNASVVVQSRADSLLLIIEDDGLGFVVPDATDTNGRHFGLMGMRERVDLIGGKLSIESAPGSGTTVYIELPRS